MLLEHQLTKISGKFFQQKKRNPKTLCDKLYGFRSILRNYGFSVLGLTTQFEVQTQIFVWSDFPETKGLWSDFSDRKRSD